MKTKLILVFLTIFTSSITNIKAQSSEKDIPKEFFKIFETNPLKAMDYAFSTNKWMERNVDGIESVKTKFKDIVPLIGKYYGFELIAEKSIGANLKLQSYLARYDRQPVRFTFILYKPRDKWQVQNLNWDVNVEDEIEESAKQNRI